MDQVLSWYYTQPAYRNIEFDLNAVYNDDCEKFCDSSCMRGSGFLGYGLRVDTASARKPASGRQTDAGDRVLPLSGVLQLASELAVASGLFFRPAQRPAERGWRDRQWDEGATRNDCRRYDPLSFRHCHVYRRLWIRPGGRPGRSHQGGSHRFILRFPSGGRKMG